MKKSVFLGNDYRLATVSDHGRISHHILVTSRLFSIPRNGSMESVLVPAVKVGRYGVDSTPLYLRVELLKKQANTVNQETKIHRACLIESTPISAERNTFSEYMLVQQKDDNSVSDKLICLFETPVEANTPIEHRFIVPEKPKTELDLVYHDSNYNAGRRAYGKHYKHALVAVLKKGSIVMFDRTCMTADFLWDNRIPAVVYYMWTGKELVRQTLEERKRNPEYFASQQLY